MRCESGRAWFAAAVGTCLLCLPARAQGEPGPAGQHYPTLLAAGEALEAWADQRLLPWPQRPVAVRAVLPPEPLWDAVSARWTQAGPALRGAYARLAYLQALKTDQWLQVSGEPGTPTVDRLLAAVRAPLTRALLALDDLRRFLDYAASPAGAPVPPTLSQLDATALEAAADALRTETGALTAAYAQAPLLLVLQEMGGPLGLSQMHMTRHGREMALTLPFPTVRHGADLVFVLGLLAGVATASAPDAERVFLLLHEQGLPLAEVEIPSAALAAFVRKESDLRAFWRSWRLVDYTAGAPLAAAELLYPPGQSPVAGQYSPPVQVPPSKALEIIGLGARVDPGELLDAARQDFPTPAGPLYLGAMLAAAPGTAQRLAEEGARGLEPADRRRIIRRGPALILVNGPPEFADRAVTDLGRVYVIAEQPPVEVPPPVLASLRLPSEGGGGTPPPTPDPAPPAPEPASPAPEPAISGSEGISADACLKAALFCRGVNERNQPQGIATVFPAGTSRVGLYFEVKSAPKDTELVFDWYREGRLVLRQTVVVSGDQKAISYLSASPGQSLRSGAWEVRFFESGAPIGCRAFRIE